MQPVAYQDQPGRDQQQQNAGDHQGERRWGLQEKRAQRAHYDEARAAQDEDAHANQAAQAGQPKISKADAEHRLQQRYPGANIMNVVESTVNGHKVWALSFSTTGAPAARKAYVDQETGKVSY